MRVDTFCQLRTFKISKTCLLNQRQNQFIRKKNIKNWIRKRILCNTLMKKIRMWRKYQSTPPPPGTEVVAPLLLWREGCQNIFFNFTRTNKHQSNYLIGKYQRTKKITMKNFCLPEQMKKVSQIQNDKNNLNSSPKDFFFNWLSGPLIFSLLISEEA